MPNGSRLGGFCFWLQNKDLEYGMSDPLEVGKVVVGILVRSAVSFSRKFNAFCYGQQHQYFFSISLSSCVQFLCVQVTQPACMNLHRHRPSVDLFNFATLYLDLSAHAQLTDFLNFLHQFTFYSLVLNLVQPVVFLSVAIFCFEGMELESCRN